MHQGGKSFCNELRVKALNILSLQVKMLAQVQGSENMPTLLLFHFDKDTTDLQVFVHLGTYGIVTKIGTVPLLFVELLNTLPFFTNFSLEK